MTNNSTSFRERISGAIIIGLSLALAIPLATYLGDVIITQSVENSSNASLTIGFISVVMIFAGLIISKRTSARVENRSLLIHISFEIAGNVLWGTGILLMLGALTLLLRQ